MSELNDKPVKISCESDLHEIDEWPTLGKAGQLIVDDGREYTDKEHLDLCMKSIDSIVSRNPHMCHLKGTVERLFYAINLHHRRNSPSAVMSQAVEKDDCEPNDEYS